jgi:hypothetical protein
MLNSSQHSGAGALIPNVEKIIDPLADLIRRAHDSDDVEVMCVNDNYATSAHSSTTSFARRWRLPRMARC